MEPLLPPWLPPGGRGQIEQAVTCPLPAGHLLKLPPPQGFQPPRATLVCGVWRGQPGSGSPPAPNKAWSQAGQGKDGAGEAAIIVFISWEG